MHSPRGHGVEARSSSVCQCQALQSQKDSKSCSLWPFSPCFWLYLEIKRWKISLNKGFLARLPHTCGFTWDDGAHEVLRSDSPKFSRACKSFPCPRCKISQTSLLPRSRWESLGKALCTGKCSLVLQSGFVRSRTWHMEGWGETKATTTLPFHDDLRRGASFLLGRWVQVGFKAWRSRLSCCW